MLMLKKVLEDFLIATRRRGNLSEDNTKIHLYTTRIHTIICVLVQ